MERMESLLRRFHLMKESRDTDTRQQLKKDLFAFNKCSQHGFPNKPTSIAYDAKLQLLAIGDKSGDIRIYGSPGVSFAGQHESFIAVNHIYFLNGQGRLITLCSDNTLHLWQINTEGDRSSFSEITFTSPLDQVVSASCLTLNAEHLLLGTDKGTLHQLDIVTFKFKFKEDGLVKDELVHCQASDDEKPQASRIESISCHPSDSSQFLIGYQNGFIVMWDNIEKKTLVTFSSLQSVLSLSFSRDGSEFVSSHTDGSYIVWSSDSFLTPKENATTPYGPFPCKAIDKIQRLSCQNGDQLVIFSGGMPRVSHGERHTVTAIHGSKHVVFDLTSPLIDFIVICSSESTEYDDPHSLLILAEEELIVVDLLSEDWPLFNLPYLTSIHASAILCASHVTDVPDVVWDCISAAGKRQSSKYSTRSWPIKGGATVADPPANRDLLLTGHEDGSVRFWDVSSSSMRLLYKLSTSAIFGIETAAPCELQKNVQGDDEWPPFRKVSVYDPFSDDPQLGVQKVVLCCASKTLIVAGTAGQVIVLHLGEEERLCEPQVISVMVVGDQDVYTWKGQDPLTVKVDGIHFTSGFQPTCVVQVHPPMMVTAVAVSDTWKLLAVGTAHGFALVDYEQKKTIFVKCTLVHPGRAVPSRRRSIKKSLRESFRRLNKRRLLQRRTVSEPGPAVDTVVPCPAAETTAEQSVTQTVVAAPSSPTIEIGLDQSVFQISLTKNDAAKEAASPVPTQEDPGSPSPIQSPTTPVAVKPVTETKTKTETEALEPSSTDELTASVVRCFCLVNSYVANAHELTPSLWVGTNAGKVLVYRMIVPNGDSRGSGEVQCTLVREIQLRHRAPVVSINVVDSAMKLVSTQSADTTGNHQVIISSEEQIKIFTLPSLKSSGKCRVVTRDGAKIRKVNIVSFTSKIDESYVENDVVCLTTIGEAHVYSLPHLRSQFKTTNIKCDKSTANACLFTTDGKGFFLNSPSEYQCLSLSARDVTKPQGHVTGLEEHCRPSLQLEQECLECLDHFVGHSVDLHESDNDDQTMIHEAMQVEVVIISEEQQTTQVTRDSNEIHHMIEDGVDSGLKEASKPQLKGPSKDDVHQELHWTVEVLLKHWTMEVLLMNLWRTKSSKFLSMIHNVFSTT